MYKNTALSLDKLFFIGIAIILFSCRDDIGQFETNKKPLYNNRDGFVSLKEANLVAVNIDVSSVASGESNINSRAAKKENKSRKIRSYRQINDRKGNAAFYIYNYEEEGFSIISGDKRTLPVLAYSDEGYISNSNEDLPCGLQFWMGSMKEEIYGLRIASKDWKDKIDEYAWEWSFMEYPEKTLENAKIDPPDDDPLPPNVTVGPFMTTTWGQGCGYNDLLGTCSSGGRCGRQLTGCVATAIAQVVRFHERSSPTTPFNWGAMPNRLTRSGEAPELARLMEYAGESVMMNYGCSASGANTADGEHALINWFWFSPDTDYLFYSSSTVKSEIGAHRPVILRGRTENIGGSGHAWVADGYKTYNTQCCGYLYFHMNWGWNDNTETVNGWYGYNDWSPRNVSPRDYAYHKKMLLARP